MIQLTGHVEDHEVYETYIQRALVIGMEHYSPHMTEIEVLNESGEIVGRYKSVDDAAKKLGIHRANLNSILKGKRHSSHGYLFRRIDPVNTQWKR